jgi:hypothetical protein
VIYSKKSKDPREVSLLAIQDALNIHNATSAATSPAMEGPNQARGTARARRNSESIVQFPQQRRPARTPFYIASLFAAGRRIPVPNGPAELYTYLAKESAFPPC